MQPSITKTATGTDFYETNVANVVQSVSAGTGISLTGTATAPIVNNSGVLSVSSGTGITVGGTPSAPSISNAGVLGISASSGITLSGTPQNPQLANAGVLSVSAGTNVTLGGTAQSPVINASGAGTNTVTIVGYPSGVALSATNSGGANVIAIAGTDVAVSAGQWLMINGEYALSSTATSANPMYLFGEFAGIGRLINLFSAPETTLGATGASTYVVQVPVGTSSFRLAVSGSAGSGTITGSATLLSYSALALA